TNVAAASAPMVADAPHVAPLRPTTDAAAIHAAAEASADEAALIPAALNDPSPLPPALRLGGSELEAVLAPVPAAEPAQPGKAKAEIFGSMLRLELPFAKLPAVGVFRRGLAIWVVAATSEAIDVSALSALPNAPARVLSQPTE